MTIGNRELETHLLPLTIGAAITARSPVLAGERAVIPAYPMQSVVTEMVFDFCKSEEFYYKLLRAESKCELNVAKYLRKRAWI